MKIGTIIFLGFILIQIVGAILSSQAKKKEQQRQRELQQQRRRDTATAAEEPATIVIQTTPPPPSPSPAPARASHAEQMAAQRREQIEQLRQRRETRQVRSRTTGSRPIGSPPPLTTRPPAPQPARREIEELGPGRPNVREEQAQIRRRQQLERELAEQSRLILVAEEQEEVRQVKARREAKSKQRAAELRSDAKTAAAEERTALLAAAAVSSEGLREALANPGTLRSLIILKELLDPPLALRRTGGDAVP